MLRKFKFVFLIALSLLITDRYFNTVEANLDMHIKSDATIKGTMQVFFDNGNGYNGLDSSVLPIVIDKNGLLILHIKLKDAAHIKKVRIDFPENKNREYEIKDIILHFPHIEHILSFSSLLKKDETKLKNHIILQKNNTHEPILFTTGSDPWITLFSHFKYYVYTPYYIGIFILKLIIVTLMFYLLFRFIEYYLELSRYKKDISFLFFTSLLTLMITISTQLYFNFEFLTIDHFYAFICDIGLIAILYLGYISLRDTHKAIKYFFISLEFILLILTVWYLLSIIIYSVWGSYISGSDIDALIQHGSTKEIYALIYSYYGVLFLTLFIVWLVIAKLMYRHIKVIGNSVLFIFLAVALSSMSFFILYKEGDNAKWFKYSTLATFFYKSAEAVDAKLDAAIRKIGVIDNFNPIKVKNNAKSTYHGKAKDMNLVVVIMESVRAENLFFYGYHRHTMPFLESLKKRMIIFNHSYVTQNRSCKTMASLMLGVYPNPNFSCMTWDYKSIHPKTSLLDKLQNNGYALYYGTSQESGESDQFAPFVKKLSHNSIMVEGREDFKLRSFVDYDEVMLSSNFLVWAKQQTKPFAAFLWTQAAHMPYLSNYKKFKEVNEVDQYDNAIYDIDRMIKNLIEGFEKSGQLDHTLFLFFGDHGEAVGKGFDFGHGKTLNDYSMHNPLMIYQPNIVKQASRVNAMVQTKDIASTLLDMLGIDSQIGQSENMFLKSMDDRIYLSNVYQEYKLGITGKRGTFSYLVEKNRVHLSKDATFKKPLSALKKEVLSWYRYQTKYMRQNIYNNQNHK